MISFPEQQWCRFSNSYLYTWANSANTDCILNTNLEPLLFQVGESKYEWMSFYLKMNQAIFVESFQFKLATLLYTLQYKYSSIAQSRPNRSEKVQRQDIKPGRIFNDLHLFSIQHFPYKFVHCVRSELKPLKLRNLSLVIKKGFVNLFWNVLLSQALHWFSQIFSCSQHCDLNEYVYVLRLKYKMNEIIFAVCKQFKQFSEFVSG